MANPGMKHTLSSPPECLPKRPKFALTSDQLNSLVKETEECAEFGLWSSAEGVMTLLYNALPAINLLFADLNVTTVQVFSSTKRVAQFLKGLSDRELQEWEGSAQSAKKGKWEDLVLLVHSKLQETGTSNQMQDSDSTEHNPPEAHAFQLTLDKAYKMEFIGAAHTNFIRFLAQIDDETSKGLLRSTSKPLYAKAISVVQSPGMGKSRMMTEVGRAAFTLPICLRHPKDLGYPPADDAVRTYFDRLWGEDPDSYDAHHIISCFIAASHSHMLLQLQTFHREGHSASEVLSLWHQLMEPLEDRTGREAFFNEVVCKAKLLVDPVLLSGPTNTGRLGQAKRDSAATMACARKCYLRHVRAATKNLANFIAYIMGKNTLHLLLTYFDEADELGPYFWTLLRLLTDEVDHIDPWYVFMATKSGVSTLDVSEKNRQMLPPYVALGFDQHAPIGTMSVQVSDLQTLEHVCKFGRPLWYALYKQNDDVIRTARKMLTAEAEFRVENKSHVLAVLSQRLCLEPALASSEATELAERSVSDHMRLLIGISPDRRAFYTSSPSEPVLVLGATNLIYKTTWSLVINTLNKGLREAELIEKGLVGELTARTLLLIARDYATLALVKSGSPPAASGVTVRGSSLPSTPDLLLPVKVISFLHHLFGQPLPLFDPAFDGTYVNFTHWILTRDSLPEPEYADRGLLANLWARHAALQCCFNQESLDLLIPTYHGSMTDLFDPDRLSAIIVQVKNNTTGDPHAGDALRPIGIPNDLLEPLPYLVILMELGTESTLEGGENMTTLVPSTTERPLFQNLRSAWTKATEEVRLYHEKPTAQRELRRDRELKDKVESCQRDMESWNRYSLCVRGASPEAYGILEEANITVAFRSLLDIVFQAPTGQESLVQRMQPLARLGKTSGHTAWMADYVYKKPET